MMSEIDQRAPVRTAIERDTEIAAMTARAVAQTSDGRTIQFTRQESEKLRVLCAEPIRFDPPKLASASNDEREWALTVLEYTLEHGSEAGSHFRAGHDAGQAAEREKAERELAVVKESESECYANYLKQHARAEQLERDKLATSELLIQANASIEAKDNALLQLQRELAAERERCKGLQERLGERATPLEFEHQQLRADRAESALAAERAESKRCREAIERVRSAADAMPNGLARSLVLTALSAAPPAEVPCEEPNHDGYGDVGQPCPGCTEPSRQRIDKLGLDIERGQGYGLDGPEWDEIAAECAAMKAAPPTELECRPHRDTVLRQWCERNKSPWGEQAQIAMKAAYEIGAADVRATELERLRTALGEIAKTVERWDPNEASLELASDVRLILKGVGA